MKMNYTYNEMKRAFECGRNFQLTGENNFQELIEELNQALPQTDVSGSVIKPPIGLIPKRFYEERVRVERFNQVCGAISRYYNAGLQINIEWIEEYNDLVESVGKHYR